MAATFFAAFAVAVFTGAFLTAACLAAMGPGFAAAALFAAHRLFVAAMIRFKPSSLMRRFALGDSGAAATFLPLWNAAHRLFCAAAILARAATLNIRFGAAFLATTVVWMLTFAHFFQRFGGDFDSCCAQTFDSKRHLMHMGELRREQM